MTRPRDNALIMTIDIREYRVLIILIDNNSCVDILFWNARRGMEIEGKDSRPAEGIMHYCISIII